MKKHFGYLCFYSICFLIGLTTLVWGNTNYIRAKMGIEINSGQKIIFAKSKDQLKAGDLLRIYVHPEKAAFVYVIYSDKKNVSLITTMEQKGTSSTLVIPSVNEYYEVDGQSSSEVFTIIISPENRPDISGFFQSTPSYKKWLSFEKQLNQNSKIKLNQKSDTGFIIAGNVRGAPSSNNNQTLLKKLKIFTGNSMVVKTYEFKIKK